MCVCVCRYIYIANGAISTGQCRERLQKTMQRDAAVFRTQSGPLPSSLHVCMYVYIYIYMYVYICKYTHTYIYIYT